MDSYCSNSSFLNLSSKLHSIMMSLQQTDLTRHRNVQVPLQCCQNLQMQELEISKRAQEASKQYLHKYSFIL